MPVTPFHAGPGVLLKAAIPKNFSFLIFCFAQVITDCETAYHIFRGNYPLHRWFHTFLGATVVAAFCVIVGRPFCQLCLPLVRRFSEGVLKQMVADTDHISLRSAIIGAFLGTYSHVFLDAIVHSDVVPFRPFTAQNPFYGLIGWSTTEWLCLVAGSLGALWLAARVMSSR